MKALSVRCVVLQLVVVLIFSPALANAAQGRIRAADGELVLLVEPNHLKKANGDLIGFMAGNTFRNASGLPVLRMSTGGDVLDPSGRRLGSIDNSGSVRAGNGERIGYVDGNGIVRSASGKVLGSGEGVDRRWLGVFSFFSEIWHFSHCLASRLSILGMGLEKSFCLLESRCGWATGEFD